MANVNPASQLPTLPQPLAWLVTGMVRHSVVALGASLLTDHIFNSAAQQTAFDNWATDSVMVVAGLAWSFLNHKAQTAQGDSTPNP